MGTLSWGTRDLAPLPVTELQFPALGCSVPTMDHQGSFYSRFWGITYCFPEWLHQFTFPPAVCEGLFSPHPHQHLLSVPFFFITTILTLYFIVVLLCISLMISNIEQTCSQILSRCSPFGTPILWMLLHLPWSQRSLNLPSFFKNSILLFSVHDFQCSVFQFTDSFLYII